MIDYYEEINNENIIRFWKDLEIHQKQKDLFRISTAEYLKSIISDVNIDLNLISKLSNIEIIRLSSILDGEIDPTLSEVYDILMSCNRKLSLTSKSIYD